MGRCAGSVSPRRVSAIDEALAVKESRKGLAYHVRHPEPAGVGCLLQAHAQVIWEPYRRPLTHCLLLRK
jgi:hypothetical protein